MRKNIKNVEGNFYPRPPRGGRPTLRLAPRGISLFLSTPSARRATGNVIPHDGVAHISIHALREEGDHGPPSSHTDLMISIHALREEGDPAPPPRKSLR